MTKEIKNKNIVIDENGVAKDLTPKPENDKIHFPVKTPRYPTQAFVDKVGKNNAWAVIKGSIDFTAEKLHYVVAASDIKTVENDVTFKDACEMFGWSGFKVSEDELYIYPEYEDKEEIEDKPDYPTTDEHFNDATYNWLSENRCNNKPMNNDMAGVSEINAQLSQNGGVYYGKYDHPITDDFFDNIKLAMRESSDSEVVAAE